MNYFTTENSCLHISENCDGCYQKMGVIVKCRTMSEIYVRQDSRVTIRVLPQVSDTHVRQDSRVTIRVFRQKPQMSDKIACRFVENVRQIGILAKNWRYCGRIASDTVVRHLVKKWRNNQGIASDMNFRHFACFWAKVA